MNREFAFKEVLLEIEPEDKAGFSNAGNKDGEKRIIEAKVLAVGNATSGFYKPGDKVLVHDSILIQRNHKYFNKNERMVDMENQIICRIT